MYVPDNREQVEIRCPFTDLGLIMPAIELYPKKIDTAIHLRLNQIYLI